MELNISEIEDIPENRVPNPIRVIKKIDNEIEIAHKQYTQGIKTIPKPYAKMVRQQMPEQRPKISYDDILKNMGMVVVDGKVHLIPNINTLKRQTETNVKQTETNVSQKQSKANKDTYVYQEQTQNQYQDKNPQIQNSYIYNKYFNEEKNEAPSVRVPKNIYEYRDMLIHDILQKQKMKQIKSTKMIMPNSNINFSAPNPYKNVNSLFDFSKRI
jgi:hypothetical protein